MINKEWMFENDKGKYLDIILLENKNGKGKFGSDGFVVQNIPKAVREQNPDVKGSILGDWEFIYEKGQRPPAADFTPSDEKSDKDFWN